MHVTKWITTFTKVFFNPWIDCKNSPVGIIFNIISCMLTKIGRRLIIKLNIDKIYLACRGRSIQPYLEAFNKDVKCMLRLNFHSFLNMYVINYMYVI